MHPTTSRSPTAFPWKAILLAVAGVMALGAKPAVSATPTFSLENLKRDTQVLSSDEFEGRGPLSTGEDKTVAYVTAAMQKAGLAPGFNGSYVQPVPLVQTETQKSPAPRFEIVGPSG